MNKITIMKSPIADTRSADHLISLEELRQSTTMHISDVRKAMNWFSKVLAWRGVRHDWTKVTFIREFYCQFSNAQKTGEWGTGWYDQIHIAKERHHLKDCCPEDVNLIDVLEMLCDCVMAGLARSGKYRDEEPDPEMLVKAYKNTVQLLIDAVEIADA